MAELGVFGDPRGEPTPQQGNLFRPTNIIYMHPNVAFGWRIRLPCAADDKPAVPPRNIVPRTRARVVEYREVMHLPAPGDWDGLLEQQVRDTLAGLDAPTQISDGGRTATTVQKAECVDGWLFHTWTLSPHDPSGLWRITVEIKGYAPIHFRATFIAVPAPP